MHTNPLVSIVIPVYNQKLLYFREALESALNQTYTNIEVVISENHSTNEIPDFLARHTDPRLRVEKPDQFLPMSRNFQFGADQARGEYVVFLCSDDYLCPDFVSSLVEPLEEHPNVSFAYGELACVEHYDLDKVRYNYHRKETGLRTARASMEELLRARPLLGFFPALMMRRSAYTALRHVFSGEFIFAFDIATVFSLHQQGDVFYLDKLLGKLRYWTSVDGKTSDDRFLEFVADTSQLCQLVERLDVLGPNNPVVAAWRKFQARRWTLVALFWSVQGNVPVEKARQGIQRISRDIYAYPALSSLVTWALTKPQTWLIRPTLKGAFASLLTVQKLIKQPM